MARAEIFAGNCGFNTTVEARMNGSQCALSIESECEAIQRLATELTQVEPFQEISFRRQEPLTMQLAAKYCNHASCPIPSGIIKAVEVEAGLALPTDVVIKLSKSKE